MADVNPTQTQEAPLTENFPAEDAHGVDPAATDENLVENAESAAELEAELDAKGVSDAKKKALLKKFKIKIDGKEEDMELDLNDEESLKKHLQLSKVAQRRMQEAAELKKVQKQIEDDLKNFVGDMKDIKKLKAILKDPRIGVDLKQLAQDIIDEEVVEAKKSPEQKEKEELLRKLEEKEKEAKELKDKQEQERLTRLEQEYAQKFDQQLTEALKKSKIPKSAWVVRHIASKLESAIDNGLDVEIADIIPLVEKDYLGSLKEHFDASPEQALLELIGENNAERLRKYRLGKMPKKPASASAIKGQPSTPPKEEKPQEKVDMRSFFRGLK